VARLAQTVLDLNPELADVDAMIEAEFQQHRFAAIITSMPGFGHLLGAELLATTNGDLTSFNTADRLAGIAGLAPVPRDSGRISGNLKRPRRYDRRLLRVFHLAANNSIKTCPESRNYYDRKRSGANAIRRRSCAWHGAASMSCGLCNATTPATNPDYRAPLDNLMETHSDVLPLAVSAAKHPLPHPVSPLQAGCPIRERVRVIRET
jgi:transposase IS116/IS110/IS902 family protein